MKLLPFWEIYNKQILERSTVKLLHAPNMGLEKAENDTNY